MATAKEIADKIIAENKVAVFSKSYCPYCKRAKDLLDQLKIEYYAIELDVEADGAAIQAYLQELSGQRTVPNIFINGKHVGGCDDLFEAKSSGKLQQLLA
ncbi:thioredoxin-like protein [Syncephalastrum racemosum]|uniref:Thioredoxin-like protein n=1 Tax=Syncephalastrum racemosum TaxID=13706 RepID=A0A1X2H2Y0_SYNRA|nr:thioredoxin-like protein [Syncephalastrum racemosum]